MSDIYLISAVVGIGLFNFLWLIWPKKHLTPEDLEKESRKILTMNNIDLSDRYYFLQTKILRGKATYGDQIIYDIIEKEMCRRKLI